MSHHHVFTAAEIAPRVDRPLPAWVRPLTLGASAVGILAFLAVLVGGDANRAWRVYHINWLYWTGLSMGLILFSAVTTVAKGRWSAPIRRFGEAAVAWLPVAFLLFLPLWFARSELFSWVRDPQIIAGVPGKAFWLRDTFMFGRDAVALLLLFGVAIAFVRASLAPDAALLKDRAPAAARGWYEGLARGFDAAATDQRRQNLAPLLIVLYAVVMGLIGFDLVMSLAPYWVSNLYGGFFFIGAWLSGLMSLAVLTIFWRRHLALDDLITTNHIHDIGKLCFGFTVFWGYLFFSQFLPIWYGNLPEEIGFLYLRMRRPEWSGIAAAMVLMCFLIPFLGLLFKHPKRTPALLLTVAGISLAGIWVDRYVFTVPSIMQTAPDLPLGWQEVLITVGFFGLWGQAYAWFASRFPMVSPSLVQREGERRAHAHASF